MERPDNREASPRGARSKDAFAFGSEGASDGRASELVGREVSVWSRTRPRGVLENLCVRHLGAVRSWLDRWPTTVRQGSAPGQRSGSRSMMLDVDCLPGCTSRPRGLRGQGTTARRGWPKAIAVAVAIASGSGPPSLEPQKAHHDR